MMPLYTLLTLSPRARWRTRSSATSANETSNWRSAKAFCSAAWSRRTHSILRPYFSSSFCWLITNAGNGVPPLAETTTRTGFGVAVWPCALDSAIASRASAASVFFPYMIPPPWWSDSLLYPDLQHIVIRRLRVGHVDALQLDPEAVLRFPE